MGRTTWRGCSSPAHVTSLAVLCTPLQRGRRLAHPVAWRQSAPLCPPHLLPRAPGHLLRAASLPPAHVGLVGSLVKGSGPRAAGCAADGMAAVSPVEASARGCGPGPRRLAQAGRAGVSASGAGAKAGSLLPAPRPPLCAQNPAVGLQKGKKKPILGLHGCGSASVESILPTPLPPGLGSAILPVNTCFPGAISHGERRRLAVLTSGQEAGASVPFLQVPGLF